MKTGHVEFEMLTSYLGVPFLQTVLLMGLEASSENSG